MLSIDTKPAIDDLLKQVQTASNTEEALKITQAILNLVQAQSIASNIKS